ncbi:MAG: glycosyltransferase family 4 protein [Candidatus Bathyarchaeota archaeon]|nr:glycosyltransferase family 4 protein [Candidatus Bathyarchaeota archaeon]
MIWRDLLLANYSLGTPTLASVKEVAYVSTFPPRKCGIATFTADLVNSMGQLNKLRNQKVISIDGRRLFKPTFEGFEHKIGRDFAEDYVLMANFLNNSLVNVVNIQHEFGIFGGESGEYICQFLDRIKRPVATTLHTVLPNFENKAKEVFHKVVEKSSAIVVLNETTRSLLSSYGVPSKKVKLIPHGCPDLSLVASSKVKPKLGLKNKVVLSTFGLLGRGKGIEHVIEALPKIVKKEPRLVYYVLGVTHPQVKKAEGEEYRNSLLRKAKNLGLRDHVRFLNRFLSKAELYNYLQATDIYITPYLSPNQVSSGTLSYALAAGKAVVSTPYLHAKEALGEGRGLFCRFNDSESIAEQVSTVIEDRKLRRSLEKKAYLYSRKFTWPLVAKKYLKLFDELTLHSEANCHAASPIKNRLSQSIYR